MLLVQLMLGWSTLIPMNAEVVPPRPVAVSRPAKAAVKPGVRQQTQAPTPARLQAAPAPSRRAKAAPVKPTARAAKKPAKAAATPAARRKPAQRKDADSPQPSADFLSQLPYQPDDQVVVNKLPNGLLTWCKGQKSWKVVEVRFAIAAGSANDPKGLYGRSRFLAELLRKKLNQPKNPARSILPEGGQRYHVKLGKDWVEVQVRSTPEQLPAVLKHLTQSLQSFANTKITKDMRDSLSKTSRTFPPPSLPERVDAYLFGGQPRGALLRGKKRTYRTIQPFALRSTFETLYSGDRMRLLLVGGLDCKAAASALASTLGKLPRGKDEPLFVNSVPSGAGKSRPLVSAQEIVMVYQLPDLFRHSYLPLVLLRDVSVREVQHQIQKTYGVTVKVHSYLQPSAKGGYLVLIAPTQPLARKKQTQLLKKALGWLQMKSYTPALEQRVYLYLQEILLDLSQKLESSRGTAEVLWPQLLLPEPPRQKAEQAPAQVTPVLESVKPKSLRELALLFMNKDLSVATAMRPFSLRRIALFVGTIILIWLLLDIFLRRTRREE